MNDRPVNILVECQALIASVRLGVLAPLAPLEDQGKCFVLFKETRNISYKDVLWCDMLISVRGSDKAAKIVAKTAKAAGRFVAYFLDDDLLNIPSEAGSAAFFRAGDKGKYLRDILAASDVLWCVNAFLGERYGEGKRVVCGKVPAVVFREPEPLPDTVRILYAGSTDHQQTFREFVSPAIAKLCDSLEEQISITIIGPDPGLEDMPNLNIRPFMASYEEYKRFVINGGFHIGIGVIREADFYRCKYYNKFIEYSSIGAMGVYTESEPYTLVVEDNINGLLCRNEPDDWYQALLKAVTESELRLTCAQNAQKLLAERFSPANVALELAELLPEVISYYANKEAKIRFFSLTATLKRVYYFETIRILWKIHRFAAIPMILRSLGRKIFGRLKS